MIERYLEDLRAELRVPADAIVAEVEDHLTESAARHGESVAIERFGPAPALAARFNADALRASARTSVTALVVSGAVLLLGFLSTDLSQPRAPWPDRAMPLGLEWQLHAAILAGQVALAAGVTAFLHRVRGARLDAIRAAVVALVAAGIALVFHAAFQLHRLTFAHRGAYAYVVIAGIAIRAVAVAVGLIVATRAERRVRAFHPEHGLLPGNAWLWCAGLAVVAAIAVFAHDEATRVRSLVDGALEAATVVAAFALLKTRLRLAEPASGAAYTARRTRQ